MATGMVVDRQLVELFARRLDSASERLHHIPNVLDFFTFFLEAIDFAKNRLHSFDLVIGALNGLAGPAATCIY